MGLRLTQTAVVAALALLSVGAAGANAVGTPVRTVSSVNQLESQVLGQLNAVRRNHGLAPLRLSLPLSAAADAHSRAMGKFGFFSHESRDGSEFWARVKRWYGPSGYRSWAVGENLLWSS
ncbi:MAG: CAP domain-containing protein, partial [Gaiellaceae bacterium]